MKNVIFIFILKLKHENEFYLVAFNEDYLNKYLLPINIFENDI
jgi:hypothetical protein